MALRAISSSAICSEGIPVLKASSARSAAEAGKVAAKAKEATRRVLRESAKATAKTAESATAESATAEAATTKSAEAATTKSAEAATTKSAEATAAKATTEATTAKAIASLLGRNRKAEIVPRPGRKVP
jgi:hypothetical protein